MESKAPSICRLCNISLAGPSVWRQHAKSDSHVYNLRVKVAEPGTVITPPSSSPRRQTSAASSRLVQPDEDVDTDASNYESADEDLEPAPGLQFNPHQCLFCSAESNSSGDSLQHMSKTHSFTIPCQEHLVVDVETIVAYLHLVICGYSECIQCGCRKRSVEGIQHHMTAKGHCRFDIVSDMEEFYNMPLRNYTADGEPLLLPSGRLLSNPTRASGPLVSRTPRSTRRRMALTTLPTAAKPGAPGADAPAQSSSDAPLSSDTQLSRLAKGDQQSLREAKHSELKLSKAGNVTLMGTFRADTSKRFRGPWG
ncbi:hypothetical protein LLEC1_06888 [Akanthomyces lecanii]|uniref:C2H2-type domain-containing protein n=1 Tax=Cordyceps confragosa TaxID=2714763 RepID=A0A179I8T7_CORDF|nr:hypothetical protein LLEC1_06888 [Akanthomyces lecanii]